MSNLTANHLISSPKILLVKLSSLGDVLHNLPIVWDLRTRLPDAQIDWVVEEGYVHLLKPLLSRDGFKGIDHIIPFGLRRWKKNLLKLSTWQQFFAFRKQRAIVFFLQNIVNVKENIFDLLTSNNKKT